MENGIRRVSSRSAGPVVGQDFPASTLMSARSWTGSISKYRPHDDVFEKLTPDLGECEFENINITLDVVTFRYRIQIIFNR